MDLLSLAVWWEKNNNRQDNIFHLSLIEFKGISMSEISIIHLKKKNKAKQGRK